MSCDYCVTHSAKTMAADGVPSAPAAAATSGLSRSRVVQERCSHCEAWLSRGGQCKNPKCPGPAVEQEDPPSETSGDITAGDVEGERELLRKTLETLSAEYGERARVTLGQFVEATETAKQSLGATGAKSAEQGSAAEDDGASGSPDRWVDFEVLSDVDTWAYDTPEDVWEDVFQDRTIDDVPHQIEAVRQLEELNQEIESASPDDLENPTGTLYAPIPQDAKDSGLVYELGFKPDMEPIGQFRDVEEARQCQARIETTIAQARQGRWESVEEALVGVELDNSSFTPLVVSEGRLRITDVAPWTRSIGFEWGLSRRRGLMPNQSRRPVHHLVRAMSRPSVNVSFTSREQEKWREQWADGHVSVGPAEPSEYFEPGVELTGGYQRIMNGDDGPMYYPTRTYEVKMRVSEEEASGMTYDRITKQAEIQLRDAEKDVVNRGEVDPLRLNVERRPQPAGELRVTAVFDVVRDAPL